ncbi:MAG TPA: hypothetical protein VLE20_05195, partial [Blastocatellia bacterium]|nr:hypothetical protein [Blastocatellia bacterium]
MRKTDSDREIGMRVTSHESRITNYARVRRGWLAASQRFAKFSVVGAGGVAVQAVMLALLLRGAGLHYLAAT